MATPLMWKACQFTRTVYQKLLYRYIFYIDSTNEIVVVEQNKVKLIPFYLSFFALSTTLCMSTTLIVGFIYDHKSLSVDLLIINFALALFIILVSGLNLIVLLYTEDLRIFLGSLFQLDKWLLGINESLIRHIDKNLNHTYLIKQEIVKLLKLSNGVDFMGILMNGLVISLIFAGILLTPVGIYYDIDPGHHLIGKFRFTTKGVMSLIFRYILTQWCTLEASRTYAIILVMAMAIFNMYMECLKNVRRLPPGCVSMQKYQLIQCNVQTGERLVRYIAGILMLVGLLICLVCNIVLIRCFSVLPLELYILFFLIGCVAYMVLYESLPMATKCHDYSMHILNYHWGGRSNAEIRLGRYAGISQNFMAKYWRRCLRAQRPLSFYYGIAMFENQTKANYYGNIVMYTINILLLMEK